ncbi:efflux RND transporter permease subunit [Alistipes sp. ZOR0009]|uniref:efflux RND transporter permease subunit n=1 Tax=Alistipes sp. ZOR0009 TaxID=1339253 RepID=UPI000645BEE3|nr:efflux RND transporter permease subunit [Alistipes sp. ZOR0009]
MSLYATSIKRPVLTMVYSIIIVLFGFVGFSYLGVREYPSIDPPVVTVSTSYTGANADVIEAQITEPLEASINGIQGIKSLTSSSSDGRSRITVEFELGKDMESATNDVRDRVSQAIRLLPKDVDPPVVSKADADSDPVLAFSIQSSKRDLLYISDMANNVVKERLQTINGVSQVAIWGEKKYAMKIDLDPIKMAAYKITPSDIRTALSRENVELPAGRVEGYNVELSIRTLGRLSTVDEFNNLNIKDVGGTIIKLKDVGTASLKPENERSINRGKGLIPQVAIALIPQPGSNQVQIADDAYKRIEQLKKELPKDIMINTVWDVTQNIRKAITEVQETILLAFILVVIVIFFFLRSWRTTLIPIIAIPISLIGSFFVMYLAGFSINVLTMLGIVLTTGLVVDDAIVVLENIFKKIEHGENPYKASVEGTKEIFFAVISTTITLIAVFFPIIFLEGATGRLFREFGIVVAAAILISTFVSLTLTPMMCARLLKADKKESRFYTISENFFNWLSDGYHRQLTKFIKYRWISIAIMLFSLIIIFLIGKNLPSELAPLEDKSRLSVMATAPEGTGFEKMDSYILNIAKTVDTIPEVESVIALTSFGGGGGGINNGFVRVSLSPKTERNRSQQEIADQLSAITKKNNFAKAFVTQEQTINIGRGGGMPVSFVIQAPSFEKLKEILPKFLEKAQASPIFQVVDVDLKFNKPELQIKIDRDKARSLGVTVSDISEALQLYFSGQRYGYFIMNGKQYQVIGQATRSLRDDPNDIRSIYIRSSNNELIQLGELVSTVEESTPPQRFRYNRYISATVSANPVPGKTMGQGIEEMRKIAKETLDDSFSTTLSGISKQFEESSNSLYFAFMLAIVLIYLILAAQFESFRDPLIIMLTVPLALAGAMLSLWIFGQTMNIFSQIGIIVLVGIVTKNGILIVEFANQKKQAGLNIKTAVIEAASARLRPILMTSLATIFGTLPIALALGAASTSRIPLGIAIIGGLIFALILTLFVIPALYTFLTRKSANIKHSIDID